jgi:adenosylcobinamide-GDP ribazoletransferase
MLINSLWAAVFLGLAGWTALGVQGLAIAACALGAVALFAFYSRRKIGGFTGDTLGAACELTETVPALVMIILQGV